ncbi:MAG: hypothetical protein PHE83_17365 [Opitutaceae bacterium]|nr:hypothetical protein [Opitutaceae bacterium]
MAIFARMQIEFPVDQVAAGRNGCFCDAAVNIDLDLGELSRTEQCYLVAHIEDGVYTGSAIETPDCDAAFAAIKADASRAVEEEFTGRMARRRDDRMLQGLSLTTLEMNIYAMREANGCYRYSTLSLSPCARAGIIEAAAKCTILSADWSLSATGEGGAKRAETVKSINDWIKWENKRREARAQREARKTLVEMEIRQLQTEHQCG